MSLPPSGPTSRRPPAHTHGTSWHHHGHAHFWHRAFTRRGIVRGAGGLALIGLAGQPGRALAQGAAGATPSPTAAAMPKPIAGGGFEVEGEVLHVYDYLPGNEPSTIGDFRGLVAINHLQGEGTVTRGGGDSGGGISTPSATGDRLVYDADMRIMKGLYIAEDGEEHQGTFGFIWFDLFVGAVAPDFSNQVHDYNPGIAENGLFWTIPFPDEGAWVDLAAGKAEMHALSLEIPDTYTFANAAVRGPQEMAQVSFDVWWHSPTIVEHVRNEEQGFAATLLEVESAISFSAESETFAYVSDPPESSQALYARIGYEANGVFMPPEGMPATPSS